MIFFIVAMSILWAGYGYVGWRIINPANMTFLGNITGWIVIIVLMFLPPVSIILRLKGFESGILSWITYISLGYFSLVFVFFLVRDISWILVIGFNKLTHFVFAADSQTGMLSEFHRRRTIIHVSNLIILAISLLLTGYGMFEARRQPAVKSINVPIPNLSQALTGFRIVQITDLHVGLTVKKDFVERIVNQVKNLDADIIVFTGDLADGSVASLREDVAPLARLKARYGKYFVTGNHEYYSGVTEWLNEVQRLGFVTLQNEHTIIEHNGDFVLLAGVPDYNGGQFTQQYLSDPIVALANAPETFVKILLAHQPRTIYEASKAGFNLQISGHTHGGQYFPWNALVYLQQPYNTGLHKFENTWIYVSQGTGYWGPPIRLGTRSEITVIELKPR